MDADDDLSEHLDPELDGNIASTSGEGDSIPGPLSFGQVVFALHAVAAAAVLPLAWLSFRSGNHTRAAALAALGGLFLGIGVVFGRYVSRTG